VRYNPHKSKYVREADSEKVVWTNDEKAPRNWSEKYLKSFKASICGKVSDETLTNGLAGATITLYAGTQANAGSEVDTYVTTDDGEYCFTGLMAGEYTVTEENPESHPIDISDFDADEVRIHAGSDDIHLGRCWSNDSPLWVNTIFHRNAECWSS